MPSITDKILLKSSTCPLGFVALLLLICLTGCEFVPAESDYQPLGSYDRDPEEVFVALRSVLMDHRYIVEKIDEENMKVETKWREDLMPTRSGHSLSGTRWRVWAKVGGTAGSSWCDVYILKEINTENNSPLSSEDADWERAGFDDLELARMYTDMSRKLGIDLTRNIEMSDRARAMHERTIPLEQH
ncbi:MAG: hypothetical protein NUW37_14715 [Planctomycetes bacterium]|nr:hypothetical protein [Planctomycetota bacterium]